MDRDFAIYVWIARGDTIVGGMLHRYTGYDRDRARCDLNCAGCNLDARDAGARDATWLRMMQLGCTGWTENARDATYIVRDAT